MRDLLTVRQAAEYLGLTKPTLDGWRTEHREGLPFVRIGRSIRYRIEDLDAYEAAQPVPVADQTCATCQHGYQFAPGEYGCAIQAAMRCKPALVSRQWMARQVVRGETA